MDWFLYDIDVRHERVIENLKNNHTFNEKLLTSLKTHVHYLRHRFIH